MQLIHGPKADQKQMAGGPTTRWQPSHSLSAAQAPPRPGAADGPGGDIACTSTPRPGFVPDPTPAGDYPDVNLSRG